MILVHSGFYFSFLVIWGTAVCNETVLGPTDKFLEEKTVFNNALYLLQDYMIPCDGFIKSFTYQSNGHNFNQNLGIWRIVSETSTQIVYQKIHKIFIPKSAVVKEINVYPPFPFYVKRNDILGFEFIQANEKNNIVITSSALPNKKIFKVKL